MISNIAARKVEFQVAAMYHRFSNRLKTFDASNLSKVIKAIKML
jgi:hypothetical protein